MEFTLLCNLGGPRNAVVSLRLRLLHVWPAKSPGDIRIYNYCTLWTDETADSIEAVILAFGCLLVNKLGDDYILLSSAGTRIAVNPPVPKAYFLASRFAEKHEVVESLPVEFATAADADRQTKTLDQFLSLSRMNSSLEERYRCGGVIVDVESSTPWYYISCKLCLRAVSKRRDNTFWCPKDWQLDEEQTRVNYKLQHTLRDDSCEARFILMGVVPLRWLMFLLHIWPKSSLIVLVSCPRNCINCEGIVPLDDPTVVGDLLEYSLQPSLSGPVVAVPSLAMCAAGNAGVSSSSLRATKGKEKVSGPLLIEASVVPFSITGEPDQTVSSIAEDLQIPIPANIEREDVVAGSQILGGSHFPRVGVKAGSSPAAPAVPVPSSVQSCAPFARSTPPMISKRTSRIDESMSSEDVSHGSFTSAVKILKPSPESSPGKTSGLAAGSPSASLLVSPLAKIKVEKLDAVEITPLPHGGSSQAGADTERDSPVDSQKNPTVKRTLFKK
ncbi:unnamed protein product [Linum trigynum]|uniref:Uncharacterized protein n=1 Tax=Linum trigynum TaxID=586398 RepID=A0AAV2FWD6_9ROSI